MNAGLRQHDTEPISDRGRMSNQMTIYTVEQIVSRASAAGRAAYQVVIRAGRSVALAERAYNRAYI